MKQGILPAEMAEKLRILSQEVRRIGNGFHCDPETIAIQKDHVAKQLAILARQVGGR